MGKFQDLTGQKFGRLTVIKRAENIGKQTAWLCRCDCGNKTIVQGGSLRNGLTKSCGCLQKEKAKENFTTHGLRYTRLYKIWYNMKERCNNKKNKDYNNYGGRGIKICDEWLNYVTSFYDWSMANGYKQGLTIDRIDVNGDYEPSNCRWADAKIQARNTRRNHLIAYKGETHCISEWAEILNINHSTLYNRISKHWSIEKAFVKYILEEK